MCGIIGAIGAENVMQSALLGLQRLEYRGYDSAGIATIQGNSFHEIKALGEIQNLINKFEKAKDNIKSNICICHTRWATHGQVTLQNTHPIIVGKVAVVHNGIVDNYNQLKQDLQIAGYKFQSQTDTEVISAIIDLEANKYGPIKTTQDLVLIISKAISQLKGSFGLLIMLIDCPNTLIAVKKNMQLLLGRSQDTMFISSDSSALMDFCEHIAHIQDNEIYIVQHDKCEIYELDNILHSKNPVFEILKQSNDTQYSSHKQFPNCMIKEIYQQPDIIKQILQTYKFKDLASFWNDKYNKIYIIACGSSFYAASIAKYWIEEFTKIGTQVEISSEFAYRNSIISEDCIFIFISQSGETADTIAALKKVKAAQHNNIVSITNNVYSSIAQLSSINIEMIAGPEIAVAATKTFTAQLLLLLLLTLQIAKKRRMITNEYYDSKFQSLEELPSMMRSSIEEMTALDSHFINHTVNMLENADKVLYIGKNWSYPLAMEGALKLKELTYITAEGISSGELKHGTIAIVDQNTVSIIIVPNEAIISNKIKSTVQEIKARMGKIVLVCSKSFNIDESLYNSIITLPDSIFEVFLHIIPMQIIAYSLANKKGLNIDKPRNLAKSVTVE